MASAISRAALVLAVTLLMVAVASASPSSLSSSSQPEDQLLFDKAQQMAQELGLDLEQGEEDEEEEPQQEDDVVAPIADTEVEMEEEVEDEACSGPNPPSRCTKYGRKHFRRQIRTARRQLRRLDAKIARVHAGTQPRTVVAPVAAPAAPAAAGPRTIVHLPDLSGLLKSMLKEMERGERNRGCTDRLNKLYKLFRVLAKSWTAHRKQLMHALAREEAQKDRIRQVAKRLRRKVAAARRKTRLLQKFTRKLSQYDGHKEDISKTQYAIQKRVNARLLKDVAALRGQLKSARRRIAKLQEQKKKQAEKNKKVTKELKKELKFGKPAATKAAAKPKPAAKPATPKPTAKPATPKPAAKPAPAPPAPTPAPPAPAATAAPVVQTYTAFQRDSLQGQILAEAACTTINPGGWAFAVRRTCSSTAPPCTEICSKAVDTQAGKLVAVNALHIYENQPSKAVNQIGLKVHRYNQVGGSYCGPNYCCCAPPTSAAAATALIQESLESEHDMNVMSEDGQDSASLRAVSDKDLELLDLAVGGVSTSGFTYDGLSGQLLAQSICVGLNKQGGWTYAVRRECSAAAPNCFSVCSSLSEMSGGQLQSFNAIHVYAANKEATTDGVTGLKTYRYNSVDAGGCGPDYCCCRGTAANAPPPQLLLEEGEQEEEEEEESVSGLDIFSRDMLDGQIQAEAVATAAAPASQPGWSFAIRRDCNASNIQTCEQLCAATSEQQVTEAKTPALSCVDALHVASSQASPTPSQVGLKTFRYGRAGCQTAGCGPNYCLCWGGYNNVKP